MPAMTSATTKIFMSGRSRAIRLPARFRLEGQDVRIEQLGHALLIQAEPSQGSLSSWLQDFYATHDPLPEEFLSDRKDTPPQERDWS
jgi:antitoxin VapB